MSKVKDTDYLFISVYLRAKEVSLLTRERLERMVDAPSFEDAARVLEECGYPELNGLSDKELEAVFQHRREEMLRDVEAVCPEKQLVEAFRLKYDYHNAKVLVKAEGAQTEAKTLLSDSGTVSVEALEAAFQDGSGHDLPGVFAGQLFDARTTLARTGNPQLVDIELDKAYFASLLERTETLSDRFYTDYVRLTIDMANLRTAVRCIRGHMDEGVLRAAAIEGGNISVDRVIRAGSEGVTAIFSDRSVAEAAELGQQAINGAPLAAFERACDNLLNRRLDEAKCVSFGPAAVVAFLAALEGEITAARMVLLGKRSGLDKDALRERLRDCYV